MGRHIRHAPRCIIEGSEWTEWSIRSQLTRMDDHMLHGSSLVRCAGCLALFLTAACANTEYAGLNYAEVIAPTGESWKVVSGKDQTDTRLTITRGDVTVVYSSSKEDSSLPLAQAMKAQTDMLQGVIGQLMSLVVQAAKAPV